MSAFPSLTSAANSSPEGFGYKHSHALAVLHLTIILSMSSLSSTRGSLLSATILLCFSYNSCCIGIIALGTGSLLFEDIRLPYISGQINSLRLWFGRWCIMSSLVLIRLNLLRVLVTLQRHLENSRCCF